MLAALTGVLCAVLGYGTGAHPELLVWLLLTPLGVLLATVDMAVRRLPDVLTLPMALGTGGLLGIAELLPDHAGSWTGALLGGLALAGGYLVVFVISPDAMGFGDVKLAMTVGLALGWYGWGVLLTGAFAGVLLGAAVTLALVASRRTGLRTSVPFGPYLLLGGVLGLLLGAMGG